MTKRFRDVKVGETFDFHDPASLRNTFSKRVTKTSARTYEDADGLKYRIGSIDARVYHVGRVSNPSRAHGLTEEARNGYYGNPNPYLFSSPKWYAHALGSYLHATGRPIPTDVRMGRGDSIRCGDMRFAFTHPAKGKVAFDRVL